MKIIKYDIPYVPERSKSDIRSEKIAVNLLDWMEAVGFAFAALVLVFTFVIRPCHVVGSSMMDTLQDGNWIFATAFEAEPKYGDVVIITQPNEGRNEPLVKRVIATGGQTVDMDTYEKAVYVDGKKLVEPYIKELTESEVDMDFPVTVPEGCLFVMGDNRNNSMDSRSRMIGFIDKRYIMGKVFFRFYPLNKVGIISSAKLLTEEG